MSNRSKTLTQMLGLGTFLLLGGSLQAAGWAHVRVEEGPGKTSVKVNVPLSLVEAVVPIVEQHGLEPVRENLGPNGKVKIADLRRIWAELKKSGDFQLAQIQDGETHVRVVLEGGNVIVRSHEEAKTEVDVQIPMEIVDALLSGDGEELNIAAALRALGQAEPGRLVSVRDGETHVRVWIDETPTGE